MEDLCDLFDGFWVDIDFDGRAENPLSLFC